MPDNVVIANGMINLILEEMSYDVDDMIENHISFYPSITDEQRTDVVDLVVVEFYFSMVMAALERHFCGIHCVLHYM